MASHNEEDQKVVSIPLEHIENSNERVASEDAAEHTSRASKREKRLVLKIDLFILPLIAMVYFFASMVLPHTQKCAASANYEQQGRSDLANASVAGMTEELELSPQDYSNAANMFLVGYIFWQLPGTLLVRKIGPPRQFAAAMVAWGTITAVTVKVNSSGQLLAMRFLVGTAEAFIQGAVFCESSPLA